jgi:hypothetical protein
MPAKLMEYFNKSPRIGTLSTSSKDGKVNVACFGSPHMIDEKTVEDFEYRLIRNLCEHFVNIFDLNASQLVQSSFVRQFFAIFLL